MLNKLEDYQEAGRKAGRALRLGDWRTSRWQADWAARAIRLETPEDRRQCREAFDNAYRTETALP